MFFDKVWGLDFKKVFGMEDGWINIIEIVVIKIDKEGLFIKKYNGRCNNDGIYYSLKVFIKRL